jgi:lipid-A-disaccharide synthase
MQRKQLQPWVGLPNILCREFVVPELLQEAATPEALAQATLAWLDAPEKTQALQQRFSELHVQLQRDTPPSRFAPQEYRNIQALRLYPKAHCTLP